MAEPSQGPIKSPVRSDALRADSLPLKPEPAPGVAAPTTADPAPQMLVIRDALPADADQIAAIWNPTIRDTVITFWPVERGCDEIAAMITGRQALGHGFFVAEIANRICGFASYSQFRSGGGYAHSMEHTIHLSPLQKGIGLGRKMMLHLEAHAKSSGAKLMIGAITASNSASISFHRKLGYEQWGYLPKAGRKFDQWHDLVLMGRDLWQNS